MPIHALLFDCDGVLVHSSLTTPKLVTPIAGVQETLSILNSRWGGKMACVSAARREEIYRQLRAVGLQKYFEPYIFSGVDTPRNKPHPDVYLKAMAALGVEARHSAIIEDSHIGIQAAVAAGAVVFAYTARTDPEQARRYGAHHSFRHMRDLPALLLGPH